MTDQMIAGLIMKLVGGAILWVVIGDDLLPLVRREQRAELDPTQYAGLDREIRAGLNR